MDSSGHQESGLSKSVWSDADFEETGWHDASVHGLYVQETEKVLPRLLLDLDHIIQFRQAPTLISRQALPHTERGGCTFTEGGGFS